MGNTKQKSSGSQSATTTYTPTEEERHLLANEGKISDAALQGQIDVNNAGLSAVKNLLGGQPLPGYLSGLPGGISPEVTQGIVDRSLKDIQPYFQSAGLLNSGTNAAISARTSADIRNQSAQYNLNNLMQLLNIGVGGQAQVQQPILGNNSNLSQSLAGLRTINSTGSYNSTSSRNPFLESFYSGLGSGLSGKMVNPVGF